MLRLMNSWEFAARIAAPGSGVSEGAPPEASVDTTFALTSAAATATYPFSLGHGFAKGEIPDGATIALDLSQYQIVVKRRWNDGSVKHAVISGRAALTQNVARLVRITAGTPPGGAALTSSDIASALATTDQNKVQCGSIGTVDLANLLGSPVRTWVSGPEMVECHYRAQVGSDATLVVWFHVRLFADNRKWIRAIVENGYLTVAEANKSYVPTVTIGGSTVYNNGGSSLSHHACTRWCVEGWIGGDPQITPQHNTTYLAATKLVPNYWRRTPTSTVLNGLTQSYAPMQITPHATAMGAGGFQEGIGALPNWAALYVTSGDARAYKAALSASSAFNTYSITRRSSTTHRIPRPSDHPSVTIPGSGNGTFNLANSTATWELNHLYNEGFLAYLVTGDFWHLETLGFNVSTCYFCISTNAGTGVNKTLVAETRGVPWMLQPLGHFCAIAPDQGMPQADLDVLTNYQTLLANNNTHWKDEKDQAGINLLGKLYNYEAMGAFGTSGDASAWMQDFWPLVWGQVSNMEPLASMSEWNEVRDWLYRWPVGLCGPTGSANYHFSQAGTQHGIVITSGSSTDPTTWFDSWGDVWHSNFGSPNNESTNTLAGTAGSSADPARAAKNHRWGPLLAAIAYAKEHGASGADAAWSRLIGATNWAAVEAGQSDANFANTPVWGIVPRGYELPAWMQGLAVNTWTQISNTRVDSAQGGFTSPGGSKAFVCAYSGACVKADGSEIFLFGGGHADYAGNEVYTLKLSDDVPAWVRRRDPTATVGATNIPGPSHYSDGRPAARHTYYNVQFVDQLDRMMTFGATAVWGNGNGSHGNVDAFNPSTNDFEAAGTYASGSNIALLGAPVCKDSSGNVYVKNYSSGTLYKWTRSTATWSTLSSGGSVGEDDTPMACDTNRHRILLVKSGAIGAKLYDLNNNGAQSDVTFTGAGAAEPTDGGTLIYAPDIDRYLYKSWFETTVYQIHPTTWEVTALSLAGTAAPAAPNGNGTDNLYGRFGYAPELKVCFVINDVTRSVYVFRTS